jgi:hypothetical protein
MRLWQRPRTRTQSSQRRIESTLLPCAEDVSWNCVTIDAFSMAPDLCPHVLRRGIGAPCGLACMQPVMEHRDDARLPLTVRDVLGAATCRGDPTWWPCFYTFGTKTVVPMGSVSSSIWTASPLSVIA